MCRTPAVLTLPPMNLCVKIVFIDMVKGKNSHKTFLALFSFDKHIPPILYVFIYFFHNVYFNMELSAVLVYIVQRTRARLFFFHFYLLHCFLCSNQLIIKRENYNS